MKGLHNMAIASKLSQLAKTWKKVAPQTASFSQVPDNEYVASIKEMKLEESKKKGRLQVVTSFEIADGDYTGQTVKRFDGIEDETGMGYFKGLCEIIGMDIPDELELLQDAMNEFVANCNDLFNINVKSNNGYSNVYVNGVSDLVQSEEGEEEQQEEEVQEEETVEEETQEEEVVEEVEEQEVKPPVKVKMQSKPMTKPVAKPTVKIAPKPVAKPVVKVAVKKK